MKLYLAYGANTNLANMATRCPDAKYVCNITLNHHRLVFRGVADLAPSRGGKVVCAMWLISPKDEEALDGFEGFPYTYVKRYVTLHLQGKRHRVMFYVMRTRKYQMEPSESYEACLRGGYAQCGMPIGQIDRAISRATKWRSENASVKVGDTSKWASKPSTSAHSAEDINKAARAGALTGDAADQFLMEWYRDHGMTFKKEAS